MKVIVFANAKGGTGKTTGAVNIASALADRGRRVLLLDFDGQASATWWLQRNREGAGLVAALEARDLRPVIRPVRDRLDLIPSGTELSIAGARFLEARERTELRETIKRSRLDYDFLLIDSGPSVGPLFFNPLCAAHGLVVPVEASAMALMGLAYFEEWVEYIRTEHNPSLELLGVQPFRTNRTVHSREVVQRLTERYGELLLPSVPETVLMRDASASRSSVFDQDAKHPAALALAATTDRILERYSHAKA
jgi:chromosome partitioning protein